METAFLYSDRAWFSHLLPLYPEKKREKARRYFAERLKIARGPSYATAVAGYPSIVTESDITVLAIGHSYRNAAYHRDTHNPAILAIIGKLFFKPVSVLFVNAQPRGVESYITKGQADRLRSVGIDLGSGKSSTRLNYHDAASNLASLLNEGMEVAARELAQELAEDLEFRVQDVKDSINYLREAPGDIDDNLEWLEFWASHRADEELMRLKDERDMFRHYIRNMDFARVTPEMRGKETELADAYNKRFWALWQARGNASRGVILNDLTNIEKVAARLSRKQSQAHMLQEYRKADERLNVIEEHVSEAVAAYDEGIP